MNYVVIGFSVNYLFFSFNRPFSIGIYGHPSHSQSSYILSMYALSYNGSFYEEVERDFDSNRKTQNSAKVKKSNGKNKNAADVSTKLGIWALLDVIEMIFL